MKQTNSAIKFLLAQYRAIFKHAQIASVLAIAAAAAASSSAAAAAAAPFTNTQLNALTGNTTITLDGQSDGTVDNKYEKFTLSGGKFDKDPQNDQSLSSSFEITFNATSGESTLTSSAADGVGTISLDKSILNISGTAADQVSVTVGDAQSGAAVTFSTIDLDKGTLEIKKGSLAANTITVGGHKEAADGDSLVNLSADTTLGASGNKIDLFKGAKLSVTGKASVAGNVAISGGHVVASGTGNTLTFKGTFNANEDAAVYTQDQGVITLENGGVFKAKTLTNTSKLVLQGATTFESGSVVDAKGGTLTIGNTTATMNADTLKEFLSGTAVNTETNAKAVIQLSDGADATVDLGTYTIIDSANNKINAKLAKDGTGSLTVKGKKATYTAGNAVSGEANAAALEFDDLTLGSGDFTLGTNAVVTVNDKLTINDGNAALTLDAGSLSLAGSAPADSSQFKTVGAKSITLSGDGKLTVAAGKWSVKDLTATSGTVTIALGATLGVEGTLATKTTDSSVNVDGGTLDLTKDTTKLSLEATTVKLKNTGVVEVGADKVLKKGQDGTYGVNTGFVQNAVSGDSTTSLKLVSAAGESIKVKDKKALDDLVTAIGFTGMISGISLETTPDDGATLDKISANTDAYKDVQVTIGADSVTQAYTVDSAVLTSGTDVLTIGKDGTKNTVGSITFSDPKNDKFVSKSDGSVAGVKLTDAEATVVLAGSGEVGAITNDAAGNGKVVVGNQADGGTVKVGGIGGAAGANAVASLTVNDKVALTSTGDISAQDFVFNGTKLTATDKTITVGGTDKKVEINGGIETKSLVVADGQSSVTIAGEAKVDVDALTLKGDSTVVNVGVDGDTGSSATLEVGTLTLNSGSLIVDPDFQHKAAVAAVAKLSKTEPDGKGTDAQVLDGNIAVGMNSAVGIGFETRQDVVDLLQSYGYMTNKEILNQEKGLKAALVVNTPIKVAKDNGIIVDGDKQGAALQAAIKDTNFKNKLDLGKNSALVINSDTYGVNADGSKKGVAITFEGDSTAVPQTKGTVIAADNTSKIILAGDFDASDSGVQIFGNIDAITTPAGGITVESANGILKASLNGDGTVGTLAIAEQKKFDAMFAQASAPVRDLLKDKLTNTDPNKYDRSQLGTKFIGAVANDTDTSGVKADAAAHAATYAGAQQAAVAALGTMADAVGGRVGSMGVEASAITATGSQANGGVWLAPMYKSVDADGFAAQGASYGADIDLGGVAFGVDTVNGDMRFGAVFNIGSGDADGKGNGNGLKDEFDYYGFGMYAAMGFGNFSLVGDASLNVISHDVEGSSGLEKFGMLKASADTTAITMGVTGQYLIETPAVDVVPHMGARFIRLDTDSYDLISEQGAIATTDFEVQNVMSIPVGVTFSKALEMGGWSLAPSADLSVTFNTGDTEVDSTTVFSGVPSLALNTEVLDEVTYGVAVGLGAQYGAFGTNISVSYTGSENTDAFGINAAARYAF